MVSIALYPLHEKKRKLVFIGIESINQPGSTYDGQHDPCVSVTVPAETISELTSSYPDGHIPGAGEK